MIAVFHTNRQSRLDDFHNFGFDQILLARIFLKLDFCADIPLVSSPASISSVEGELKKV